LKELTQYSETLKLKNRYLTKKANPLKNGGAKLWVYGVNTMIARLPKGEW